MTIRYKDYIQIPWVPGEYAAHLRVDSLRATAFEVAAKKYTELGDLSKVAQFLGMTRSTLHRMTVRYPELAKALEQVRVKQGWTGSRSERT